MCCVSWQVWSREDCFYGFHSSFWGILFCPTTPRRYSSWHHQYPSGILISVVFGVFYSALFLLKDIPQVPSMLIWVVPVVLYSALQLHGDTCKLIPLVPFRTQHELFREYSIPLYSSWVIIIYKVIPRSPSKDTKCLCSNKIIN